MRVPIVYTTQHIKNWPANTKTSSNLWLPARPVGYRALMLKKRFEIAWRVFTGKLDALDWKEGDCK